MERITVRAYAKLNLSLSVGPRRPDGYHEMAMLMQSVSLHDTLTLERRESGISLSGTPMGFPEKENLAVRAADAFFEQTGTDGGVSIDLVKRIPLRAGLAGGSADAAAVLFGLDRLFGTGLSISDLAQIGVGLGADVPFCLTGGTAYVSGMGEKIRAVPALPECCFVIAKPEAGISTAAAFSAVDSLGIGRKADISDVLALVGNGDLEQLAGRFRNTFEQVTEVPEVFSLKKALTEQGALCALMSGTGSAVFGIFSERGRAERACREISRHYRDASVAFPVPGGVEVEI